MIAVLGEMAVHFINSETREGVGEGEGDDEEEPDVARVGGRTEGHGSGQSVGRFPVEKTHNAMYIHVCNVSNKTPLGQ